MDTLIDLADFWRIVFTSLVTEKRTDRCMNATARTNRQTTWDHYVSTCQSGWQSYKDCWNKTDFSYVRITVKVMQKWHFQQAYSRSVSQQLEKLTLRTKGTGSTTKSLVPAELRACHIGNKSELPSCILLHAALFSNGRCELSYDLHS